MKMFGWIVTGFLSFLSAVFLQLNRNPWTGWVLLVFLLAGFIFLMRKQIFRAVWWRRGLSVFVYMLLCGLIIAASWPPMKPVKAYDTRTPERTEIISTNDGDVRGVVLSSHKAELFAGIPYAAPPVGELRWKRPQPPAKWEGVRECDTFAPMSMQARNLPAYDSLAKIVGYHDYQISFQDRYREAVSEDSLYLNVWRPVGEYEDLPVLVYIHGGSLQTGQPWFGDYSGKGFAENGVICVNMGYRLGVFGFYTSEELADEDPDHSSGNYGLMDQIKALEWVRDNIRSFGGDPDNVTIAGESAGAVCVDALCVSPLAKGLFRGAILESSTVSSRTPPHSYRLYEDALASGKELMERYHCSSVSELRSLSAKTLVNEQNTQHHITVDGYVLPDTPYNLRKSGVHNEEAVLHGYNREESGPFILFSHASMKNYENRVRAYFGEYADEVLELYPAASDKEADAAWAAIYGAVFFNYSHYCLNRLENENGVPAYEYLFVKDNGRLGSWHSGELIYAFHNIPDHSKLFDETDRALSDLMHAYWISFAENGDPGREGLPAFEISEDTSRVMVFDENSRMEQEPMIKLYEIMDRLYGWES